jgi:nucleoside-diphosphate-sugar epimerase
MRVLLTGATSFLGRRLCSALVHSGHTVRVTVRANSVTSELPPEVEIVNCDIQDVPILIKACEGCDAVIHTAALVGSWLPDNSQFITLSFFSSSSSSSSSSSRPFVFHVSSL